MIIALVLATLKAGALKHLNYMKLILDFKKQIPM